MIWVIIISFVAGVWVLRKDDGKHEKNTPIVLGSYLIIVAVALSFFSLTSYSTQIEYEGKKYNSVSEFLPELPLQTSDVLNLNFDHSDKSYNKPTSKYIADGMSTLN